MPGLENRCRSRGVYQRDRMPLESSVLDERGRMVRAVGMTQTLLSPAQVDELVALYQEGATLVELGERFSAHRRTAGRRPIWSAVRSRSAGAVSMSATSPNPSSCTPAD